MPQASGDGVGPPAGLLPGRHHTSTRRALRVWKWAPADQETLMPAQALFWSRPLMARALRTPLLPPTASGGLAAFTSPAAVEVLPVKQ